MNEVDCVNGLDWAEMTRSLPVPDSCCRKRDGCMGDWPNRLLPAERRVLEMVSLPVPEMPRVCNCPHQAKGKYLPGWLGKSPGGKDEVSQFCRPFALSWKDDETSERKSEGIRFFCSCAS